MDQLIIEGGRPLRGTVRISGSKNSALPILIAPFSVALFAGAAIWTTFKLLESLGKKVTVRGSTVIMGRRFVEPRRL